MEFEITHTTQYRYGQPAAEAYGEVRLTPRTLPSQEVLSHRLEIVPSVATSSYTDHFGNRVDFFSLPFRHEHLVVTNKAIVRTQALAPPAQALEQTVQEARQILGSALTDVFEFLQPTSTVSIGREAVQWARKYLRSHVPLGEALQSLNEAIHDKFAYRPGSTENSTPLNDVWKTKTGVCQDFAHIGLSILRTAGLPSRYVCGYIEAYTPEQASRLTGAMATHAWIEVLVPGMTWVAIDPTNRQWTNERYVTVAYGRDFRDATPLRGTFKGSGGQNMKVRVYMKRRENKSRGVNLEISYQTQYSYEEPVSFSPHIYRLFPKTDRFLQVRSIDFQTNAGAVTTYRRDLFDNEVASCFYPEHSALLGFNLRISLDVAEKNPFSFLLASHALDFPFQYTDHEARVLAPYLLHADVPPLPFWQRPTTPKPTLETLIDLNFAIHENIEYERREEGSAYAPAETLEKGSGACRDYALLHAEVLRAEGIAARFASGYLYEGGVDESDRRAEGALHAWTEAYLPGAGWVGFDPTNGVLCNHNHLTAAVGLSPEDVTPISGRYFAKKHVPAQMMASLQIYEKC